MNTWASMDVFVVTHVEPYFQGTFLHVTLQKFTPIFCYYILEKFQLRLALITECWQN